MIEDKAITRTVNVALLGNPNSGKTTLFNHLTGLRQKVGNFPGVTVEKKIGRFNLDQLEIQIIDFPGTYSAYPTSQDERIVIDMLCNPEDRNYPEAVVYVADTTNLEKHLLFFTQLRDLKLPMLLVLSMSDIAMQDGLEIDIPQLQKQLGVPIVAINGRKGNEVNLLKEQLQHLLLDKPHFSDKSFYQITNSEKKIIESIKAVIPTRSDYHALLLAHHGHWLPHLSDEQKERISTINKENEFVDLKQQIHETMQRYNRFEPIVQKVLRTSQDRSTTTEWLDRFFTHRFWGVAFFFLTMLLVFQAIYAWATYPMDWIESGFGWLGESLKNILPAAWWTDLLTEGVLAGLGGVIVFVPQIAILFFLISILEEVGYMARAVFLFDRLMQRFGLNGRSIVALVSGGACAIPAIMSTRTISNRKERLITILVTPLISCSARIPVYTVLIGFVVPPITVGGIFNAQGLAFMGLYLLSIVAALTAALVFKLILKSEGQSFLMLEMPAYKVPLFKDILLTVWEKVSAFLIEAGKVILLISVVLWFLASFGPTQKMAEAEATAIELAVSRGLDKTATDDLVAASQMEASYAGHIGKFIEPVIRPLGYDWKIGIALLTSFAAREVFVGTMATIYSIGSNDDEYSVHARMAKERDPLTGKPVYTLATSLSLLLFYVFAMQCMATLAVVKKETDSWKWAIIQFLYMTTLAYSSAFLAYQLLSI